MRIGVFDSGLGGLTVLRTLVNKYPNNDYIYYGDTLNLPYGNKTKDELYKLACNDVEFLLKKKVDMIIIACGTISSNCLEYLRGRYKICIHDIISPTIKYLNDSNYNSIGVIATERTIDSHIFKDKISKNVFEIKTPLFVPMIENNELDKIDDVIDLYLRDYKDKIDVLVLGCTHYPIIKDKLNKYFDNNIELLDMSNLLLDKLNDSDDFCIDLYFSKLNKDIEFNSKKVLGLDNINIYEE